MRFAPTCLKCNAKYRPAEIGHYLLETAGKEHDPYKLWACDIYECPECLDQVAVGFGNNPLHRGTEEFERQLERLEGSNKLHFEHEYSIKEDGWTKLMKTLKRVTEKFIA